MSSEEEVALVLWQFIQLLNNGELLVHSINQLRDITGFISELRNEPAKFYNYCTSLATFDHLLELTGDKIKKENTNYRQSISPEERLIITLQYLSRTFRRAVDHVRPDVVMFLGDLMDEGSIANDQEYSRYLRRFNNVFQVDPSVKLVFVPGDNDVGGEDEPLTMDKLKRFHESFPQPEVIQLKYADLFKVNRLAYSVPKPEQHGVSLLANRTRIVLTHVPLLFLPSTFVQQVSTQLRPQLIFSAHDHKSLHIAADAITGEERVQEVLQQPPGGRSSVFHFPLGREYLHEIMVPTCSYRMGVYHMGYGAAVIDGDRRVLSYAVLWLPSRFAQLLLYGVLASALGAAAGVAWLRRLCARGCRGVPRRASLGV